MQTRVSEIRAFKIGLVLLRYEPHACMLIKLLRAHMDQMVILFLHGLESATHVIRLSFSLSVKSERNDSSV